jgi:hypothetical protein
MCYQIVQLYFPNNKPTRIIFMFSEVTMRLELPYVVYLETLIYIIIYVTPNLEFVCLCVHTSLFNDPDSNTFTSIW